MELVLPSSTSEYQMPTVFSEFNFGNNEEQVDVLSMLKSLTPEMPADMPAPMSATPSSSSVVRMDEQTGTMMDCEAPKSNKKRKRLNPCRKDAADEGENRVLSGAFFWGGFFWVVLAERSPILTRPLPTAYIASLLARKPSTLTAEERRIRRRAKNRQAAEVSRIRRKTQKESSAKTIKNLQSQIALMKAEMNKLRSENTNLRTENGSLKGVVALFKGIAESHDTTAAPTGLADMDFFSTSSTTESSSESDSEPGDDLLRSMNLDLNVSLNFVDETALSFDKVSSVDSGEPALKRQRLF